MKKIIVLIILQIAFFSCKEKKATKIENPKTKENKLEVKKEPSTVLDYINFGNKSNAITINDNIGNLIFVKDVSIFMEKETEKVFIVIKLNEDLAEGIYGKYKIVARMYPYTIDDLTQGSRENKIDFDSWYFEIKSEKVNGDTYLYGQVADQVDGFKKVKLQLLEKQNKKFSEKQITLENLESK